MPFKSFMQLTLTSLLRVKWRLFRILISIAIGIAAMFFMITYGNIIKVETFRRFHSEGTDHFSVIRRANVGPVGRTQDRKLNLNTVEYLSYDSDFILGAAPEIQLSQTITYRQMSFAAFVSGITENFFSVLNLKLHSGRLLSRFDQGKQHCLLGYRVYQRLRERYAHNIIGEPLHLGRNVFRIVGVLSPSKSSQSEFSIDEAIFVPYLSLAQYTEIGEISKITLKANPNRPIEDVTDFIQSSLERYLGSASIFEINNQQIFLQTITDQVKTFSYVFGIIGSLALIWGCIALLKLIIYLNFGRNYAFSLLSDTGVKIGFIRLQLILEPLLIAVLGGVLGLLIGITILYTVTQQLNWVPIFSTNTVWICLSITAILGTLVGLYPAMSVKKPEY